MIFLQTFAIYFVVGFVLFMVGMAFGHWHERRKLRAPWEIMTYRTWKKSRAMFR